MHSVMQHWRYKSKSRNADFILIAAKGGDTTTLSPKGCQTLEPSGQRPVNLKNLFTFASLERQRTQPFYTTRRRQADITSSPVGAGHLPF